MRLARWIILLGQLTAFLVFTALSVQPARAQAMEPSIVRAVLFWKDGCPSCYEALENVLPPLQEKYGEQLEILLFEVVTMEDVDHLYEVAAAYGIPRERVGVPLLILGEQVLVGPAQISAELPGLIESYLAQGGVDWPDISGLETFLSAARPTPGLNSTGAVVEVILFLTADCHSCQLIAGQALMPLDERYGESLDVQVIDIVTSEDVEYLYQVASAFDLFREQVDLPMLLIGDYALIGEQIPAELPGLVERYLSTGGVEAPILPPRFVSATPEAVAAVQPSTQPQPNGFILAILVLVGMVISLLYALGALIYGVFKDISLAPLPAWQDGLVPALCIIGLGVAGYLSYIEISLYQAICGPVGDCNAVQTSSYARLWGVLPIGVLGAGGYIAFLATWWAARQKWGWLSSSAPIALFGMAFFGTVFSAYLTYLEPFVIKAVCIWCITSAVIMTLLLLLSVHPALRSLVGDPHAEEVSS
ncbi:MAG: vitamin K epoxide reductase family protein [Chloroflexota bacterium]